MKKHKKNDKDNWQERALKETKKFSFNGLGYGRRHKD